MRRTWPLAGATIEIETEAYQTLLARARRHTGRVPPELIARHVVAVTRGADWPVRHDALAALLRRFAFGRAPDIVVLDEAQRIKNWATKIALTVKRLEPPYRLVLTGTPMENRLDEIASIVEWVDDLALEPKWCLAPWHTTPVDGTTEVGGARDLDTLRTRLASCMVRRARGEVLSQLPARTDTRIPVEMTAEQMEEDDALNMPIAQLLKRARQRPMTQPEFLCLMTLLTTQRIIANGLAQLRFEDYVAGPLTDRAAHGVDPPGPSHPEAIGAARAHRAARAHGPRTKRSHASASGQRTSPGRRVKSDGRRTSSTSTMTLRVVCCSRRTPGGSV